MRKTKMPGRAGTRAGQDKMKGESNKMSKKYCITWPSRRQWRRFVVAAIEDVIGLIAGAAFVAAVIWIASLLLKLWGVL